MGPTEVGPCLPTAAPWEGAACADQDTQLLRRRVSPLMLRFSDPQTRCHGPQLSPRCPPPRSCLPTGCGIRTSAQGHCSGPRGQAPSSLCRAMLAGESSSTQRVLVMRVLCPREVEGAMWRSRGAKTSGNNSSRVRRGWQHLRPQPRRRMGMPRRRPKRTPRTDYSRTASPLGLPLQVQIVLFLALLPCPLVVVFLLQGPDGWPPVFLEILLVFWGRTAVGLGEEDAGGWQRDSHPCPAALEHASGPGTRNRSPAFTEPLKRVSCPGSGADGPHWGKAFPLVFFFKSEGRSYQGSENKAGCNKG